MPHNTSLNNNLSVCLLFCMAVAVSNSCSTAHVAVTSVVTTTVLGPVFLVAE